MNGHPGVPPRLDGDEPRPALEARLRSLAVVAGVLVGLRLVAVWVGAGWWLPACPFRRITGHPCPTCGATSALAALGEGRLADAWRSQPLAVLIVGGVVFYAGLAVLWPRGAAWVRRQAGRRPVRWGLVWVALGLVGIHWLQSW
ncbi:MAG: DUF2752 domain-containing protein [Verrucomicrobia bacterium]|nr:MAG: DUF2752 domain-containing protein [Verrucomicrobiota bacterium]